MWQKIVDELCEDLARLSYPNYVAICCPEHDLDVKVFSRAGMRTRYQGLTDIAHVVHNITSPMFVDNDVAATEKMTRHVIAKAMHRVRIISPKAFYVIARYAYGTWYHTVHGVDDAQKKLFLARALLHEL